MPLAFETMNRGVIPFGFFNIETDMILLDHYFLFCETFSRLVQGWAEEAKPLETTLEVYCIDDPSQVGSLHGAMNGLLYTGFLGEVYKRFPFPSRPEDFKQKEGPEHRATVEAVIRDFASPQPVPAVVSLEQRTVQIGAYLFNEAQFLELLYHVWRAGMPMWREEVRPQYVLDMFEAVQRSALPFFSPSVESGS